MTIPPVLEAWKRHSSAKKAVGNQAVYHKLDFADK
jgi:hypothetical protein